MAHAAKETEFLRLKRSRLGVDDFVPLKVIGKGAFGEVRRSERGCVNLLRGGIHATYCKLTHYP